MRQSAASNLLIYMILRGNGRFCGLKNLYRLSEENSLGPSSKKFCSAPGQNPEEEQSRHAEDESGCSRRDNAINFQEIQHSLPPSKSTKHHKTHTTPIVLSD